MKQYKVGIIGGTGMVGQRFITLMEHHPWFQLTAIAASARSAGKPYAEAVAGRWALDVPMPEEAKNLVVLDAEQDAERLASMVDFCFCAVDMKKEEIRALEEKYARLECPIVSNNSAHRWTDDVPMVVPEINADHLAVIEAQRKRLGTRRGFIAVKSNCSLQSYVPALHPLKKYGLDKILVCTYQAISGAGKTFQRWPEMVDNCIPYIGGEEEKSEQEPLKLWGQRGGRQDRQGRRPLHHRPVLPGGLPGRSHGRGVHEVRGRQGPLHGADQGRLGRLPGPCPRSWSSPPPPSSSSTTLRSLTGPRPGWTGTWSTAWPCPWAACGRTPSTTTSSCASPTTPCGALPAARCSWRSCCAPRDTWTDSISYIHKRDGLPELAGRLFYPQTCIKFRNWKFEMEVFRRRRNDFKFPSSTGHQNF